MTVRTLYTLAAALSMGLAGFTSVQAKTPSTASKAAESDADANQRLADEVASRLKSSGVVRGAKFDVATQNGVVDLVGKVESKNQADEIVKLVKDMPGVTKVKSALKVISKEEMKRKEEIKRTSGDDAIAPPLPPGYGSLPPGAGPAMMSNEPMPLAAPGQPAYDTTGPRLPPYAWPTYAPYNNYSRVGYPEAYPYNAFPFIGPFYPFPKVPLGWRSVKLEWDDGHWYMGRLSTPHDYWRTKFW
jgi:hypothetical protein